jgi:O-antigen ligase
LLGGFSIVLFSKRGKLGALLTFIAAPAAALVTMGGLIWSFLERGETARQMATLSSRAQWWAFAWQTYLERPLTGFGAYAAGRFAVMAKLGSGLTSSMHSDYLEILVGTGIWGMIPFLAVLVGLWWLVLRDVRNPCNPQARQLACEGLAVLVLLTFRSIFQPMFTWHPPLHFLAVLGFAEYMRRRRQQEVQVVDGSITAPLADSSDGQMQLAFTINEDSSCRSRL